MLPKPEPIKRVKARRAREEQKVKQDIRRLVFAREEFTCRLFERGLGECEGPLEWAHLGDYRRAKTRKMAPERRHTTVGSLCLCRRHHSLYDGHRLDIEVGNEGADGLLSFKLGDSIYVEKK